MAFTSIPNSDIDVGSPITTGLMTSLRDNDDFLNDTGMQTLDRQIIAGSPSMIVDFSPTLDGNTQRVYRIIARIKNAIASTRVLSFRLNGSTFGAGIVTMPTSGIVQVQALVNVKDDVLGMFRFDVLNNLGAFTTAFITRAVSAGNVTSLGFSTGDAAIDVGSEFYLIFPGKGP